ncbi:MAG: aldo/keto reductase [Candidatus Competibacteraceae bacterium]|nr:aldo/keto reductase [Candidatus Competibacteraceae bacterium]MBK8895691.1 aldo/keto reductase [Candidatus Competibacteraceae bacterium]MBK9953285.1 aldo/keto reductase [Candidatus Competibacteraceae bacterium]
MRYKLFGNSGLRVSELCLGAMTFGEEWGWGASKDESRRLFEAFVAAGGNFIDTANHYTNGTSESYVGEFIAAERERFVLATKYTLNGRPDDPNGGGNHRKSMMQAINASLKRLGTDYIDLYWLHAWDFMTPVDEVMRAFDDLVRSGKVLYIGISDAPAWIVSRANTLAELRGWSPFVGLQLQYSLIERTPERDLLPMARALDIAVTAWGPLGGGLLTGKYNPEADKSVSTDARYTVSPWGQDLMSERNLDIAAAVVKLAEEIDRTPSQVAINWIRQQRRGVIIPILGARKLSQLQDNLAALDFLLSDEQLRRLDAASAIAPGFPHDFLTREGVRQVIYGNTLPSIDNHRV